MIARDCNNIYLKKQPLIVRFGKIVAPYTSTLNSTLWEYTTTIKALGLRSICVRSRKETKDVIVKNVRLNLLKMLFRWIN